MSTAKSLAVHIPQRTCRRWPVGAILCLLYLVLGGCASWQQPDEFDVSMLQARAESETVNDVRLSAVVLSSRESQQMFGADVNSIGVQPVWIEIDNNTNQSLWLLRSGTDPDLFSPLEVAWSFHKSFASETNARLDAHFDAMTFQNPIAPRETKSGILFTNPQRNTRLLSIDILGQGQTFPFTLFPLVPDDQTGESTAINRLSNLSKRQPLITRMLTASAPGWSNCPAVQRARMETRRVIRLMSSWSVR